MVVVVVAPLATLAVLLVLLVLLVGSVGVVVAVPQWAYLERKARPPGWVASAVDIAAPLALGLLEWQCYYLCRMPLSVVAVAVCSARFQVVVGLMSVMSGVDLLCQCVLAVFGLT